MKTIYLVGHGSAQQSFELKEAPKPTPKTNEVLIEAEGFGLNYADVMARKGIYPDAPPLPSVLGYEVVGKIVALGDSHQQGPTPHELKVGDRVVALTRFGGYAQFAIASSLACAKIPHDAPLAEATALATQYCTAYYASHVRTQIHAHDHVLIHAAAGGVGIALTQLAKLRKAIVIGTVGSDEKIEIAKANGADEVINSRKNDFKKIIEEHYGKNSIDLAFDSVGGQTFKNSYSLLRKTGMIVSYGTSEASGSGLKVIQGAKLLTGFGLFSPLQLLLHSRGILGVNMLRVADYRPDLFKLTLNSVIQLYQEKKIKPLVGKTYPYTELAQAHQQLESRSTVGKIAITW